MLPDLFGSTNIPALGEVLNFAQARHGVLAGNIANVNTPGYRLRDLSETAFQQRLKEAHRGNRTAVGSPRFARPVAQPGRRSDARGARSRWRTSSITTTRTSTWKSRSPKSPKTRCCTTLP